MSYVYTCHRVAKMKPGDKEFIVITAIQVHVVLERLKQRQIHSHTQQTTTAISRLLTVDGLIQIAF